MRFFIMLSLLLFYVDTGFSEPWVSNRFAKNCASCHLPGRYNKKLSERRCTLSCQGCHVNPNGGGLRNDYGKWNSRRWLKSFSNPLIIDQPKPKPPISKHAKKDNSESPQGEEAYDKYHDTNWNTEKSSKEYEAAIHKSDPYWTQRRPINGGFDFRYVYGQQEGDQISEDFEELYFPMAFDAGLQFRPIEQNLSFVIESRFANGPTKTEWDQLFTNNPRIRSAYMMIDDLPFNSYFMYGLYTPMFGLGTSDHTSLRAQISEMDQYSVYKAMGFGASPNVPFFTASVISPMQDDGYNANSSNDEGFTVSAGARFVTYGLSGKISYWSTKRESSFQTRSNDMIAVTGGANFDWAILNFEYLIFEKDETTGDNNKGGVATFEGKFPIFRENYLMANFAQSPNASDRSEGDVSEILFGIKSFAYAGTDIELTHKVRSETDGGLTNDSSISQLQMHLFY